MRHLLPRARQSAQLFDPHILLRAALQLDATHQVAPLIQTIPIRTFEQYLTTGAFLAQRD